VIPAGVLTPGSTRPGELNTRTGLESGLSGPPAPETGSLARSVDVVADTPGETPPPPQRTLRWRFGPHAVGHVAANGDFDLRPQRTVGPLRRWCPGLYHARLLAQRPENFADSAPLPFTDWGRDRVFARFSFRVR
jgi:hypothetical protein